MGADPDPADVARQIPRTTPSFARDEAPMLVVAAGPTRQANAAPLAEAMVRVAQPTERRVVIGIGQNVAQAFDTKIETALLAECPSLRGSFTGFTDRDVVDSLLAGQVDFGVIGGQLSMREQQAGLRQTRVGLEIYALAVAPDSPLRSLTPQQVRQVFTGQVTEWARLGLPGGRIVPVVPADAKLAERAARAMIPGDDFAASATRVGTDRHVADQTLQNPGAIGIVRITDVEIEPGLKLVPVDWIPPSFDAAAAGAYPFAMPVHFVSAGVPNGDAAQFAAFVQSDSCRERLGRSMRTK
ncbi:MAG: substrate-binding domain-containing protein [Planctomycetes bacterium]|nr:substrate-binding domain-containing protein [Planctomycetota bacterium]